MPSYGPVVKSKWVGGNIVEAAYEGYRTYQQGKRLTKKYPGLWSHRATNKKYPYRRWERTWQNSYRGRQYRRSYERYWG